MDRVATRRSAAIALERDRNALEAVVALAAAGVESIVLKGRTFARLLYDDGTLRGYSDADLLVVSTDRDAAASVLDGLGYRQVLSDGDVASGIALHAHPWMRNSDGAHIDLHHTLQGLSGAPAELWRAFRAHAVPAELAGGEVLVPDRPACAFHLAIHAADRGQERGKPLADLDRALARLDPADWEAARELARSVGGEAAMAAGLRLTEPGTRLAARLGLSTDTTVHIALAAAGAPPEAHGLQALAEADGLRDRARMLARAAFPTPSQLRQVSRVAGRGRAGLAAGYVARPFVLARLAPAAIRSWRAAREARG
jgi:hypothetical protein